MLVQELITKLGFKTDEKAIARYEKGLTSLRNIAIGVSAAVVGIGYASFKIIQDVTKTGDELEATASQIGISTDSLQKLSYSAELSNTSIEELKIGLKRFSKVIVEAKDGSKEAQKIFNKIGINPNSIKNTEDGLLKLMDAFVEIKDPILQNALAQDVLGRSGGNLINLLKQGSKAIIEQGRELEALGGIMSKDAIAMSALLDDNVKKLNRAWFGLKTTLATQVMPVINDLIIRLLKWYMANKQMINSRIINFVTDLGKSFITFAKILYEVIRVASIFIDAVGGMEKAVKIFMAAILGIVALKSLIAVTNIISGLTGVIGGFSNAVMMANLKTGLWVAGLAALFLLAQDLIYLFQGKESLIGKKFGIDQNLINRRKEGLIAEEAMSARQAMEEFDIKQRARLFNVSGKASANAGMLSPPQNINATANITVNPPAGSSPEAIGKEVLKEVNNFYQSELRNAARNHTTGGK